MFAYIILFILTSPLNNYGPVYSSDFWKTTDLHHELDFYVGHYTGVSNTNILMNEYRLALNEGAEIVLEGDTRKFDDEKVYVELKEIEEEAYLNYAQKIPDSNTDSFLNYDETHELVMSSLPNMRREEKCLILETDLGEKKFCDVPPPPNSEGIGIVKRYRLRNYIERINSYIISITHYESGEYILVNGNSGDQEKILSDHVSFSPSGNYFISTEPNYGYGLVNQGGFMIWKINNPPMLIVDSSKFKLVRDLDNPIWINDNTILFSRKQYNGDWIYHIMTIRYK